MPQESWKWKGFEGLWVTSPYALATRLSRADGLVKCTGGLKGPANDPMIGTHNETTARIETWQG
jgi:hypothetical protein